MLGVILFIAFWVVVALAIFFVAVRGGGGRAPERTARRRASRATGITFAVIYVAFGVAIPLLFLHGNKANASGQIGGNRLTSAEKRGRQLFAVNCGQCHTLAATNSVGKVGPNLDNLRPPAVLVLHTIQYGCLQNPPPGSNQACLGYGNMPAGVLQGKDAVEVSAFVAKVAGRE